MRLAPGLYLWSLLIRAAVLWGLLRIGVGILAVVARSSEPAKLAPSAAIVLVGLVSVTTWFDLHRRNLVVLLPNLGMPVAGAVGMAAGVAAAAELIVAFAVP